MAFQPLAVVLALLLVSVATPSVSQPLDSVVKLASSFEPPNDGAPGRREDAGSRPGCPQPQGTFTALVPATNFGKTVAEYPTFWLYVPYASGKVELILEEEGSKQQVYQTQFWVENAPGVIQYALSEAAPALEVGQKYRWRFFFFCNPNSQSEVLSVNGVVMREGLTPQLRSQLQQASPSQRIELYATNGLWYELVTQLAQLRQTQPENAEWTQAWTDLFQHPLVKLDRLVEVPLTACCSPQMAD